MEEQLFETFMELSISFRAVYKARGRYDLSPVNNAFDPRKLVEERPRMEMRGA